MPRNLSSIILLKIGYILSWIFLWGGGGKCLKYWKVFLVEHSAYQKKNQDSK